MTTAFSEESATGAVIDSFEDCRDDRLKAVLAGVVRHLHGFIREIDRPSTNGTAPSHFFPRWAG